MDSPSLAVIKKELQTLSKEELIVHLLRVSKYKKENKELLGYILFNEQDEHAFISEVCQEMDLLFDEINETTVYYVKKSVRKIQRFVAKQIKYSGKKETEVELLLHFCEKLAEFDLRNAKNGVLKNIFERQMLKTEKVITHLHEDMQYDFGQRAKSLLSYI